MISKFQLLYSYGKPVGNFYGTVNFMAKKSDDGKTTKPPSHLDVLLAANFLASAELMSPVGLTAKLAHCSGSPVSLFHAHTVRGRRL